MSNYDFSHSSYKHYRNLALLEIRKARDFHRMGAYWLASSCAQRAARYRRNALNFANTSY